MINQYKLIEKKTLTDNVFEMIFQGKEELNIKAGQFITFLLDGFGGRAYSILRIEGKNIILIIKKREINEGGRGGSKFICDLNIGEELRGVGPAGHFLLKENNDNKLFIGTGTGFVPLYNMIVSELNSKKTSKIEFIFGVREKEDIFYLEELRELKKNHINFKYHIYISRVKDLHEFKLEHTENIINSGYTTNFLTKRNIEEYKEVYICGAPTMIESAIEKLKKLDFNKEFIYFEKY